MPMVMAEATKVEGGPVSYKAAAEAPFNSCATPPTAGQHHKASWSTQCRLTWVMRLEHMICLAHRDDEVMVVVEWLCPRVGREQV